MRASVSTVLSLVSLQANKLPLCSVRTPLSPSPVHYFRPPCHSFQCCCRVDIAGADGGRASASASASWVHSGASPGRIHGGASPSRIHGGASARGTCRVIGCCTGSNAIWIWWVICVCYGGRGRKESDDGQGESACELHDCCEDLKGAEFRLNEEAILSQVDCGWKQGQGGWWSGRAIAGFD